MTRPAFFVAASHLVTAAACSGLIGAGSNPSGAASDEGAGPAPGSGARSSSQPGAAPGSPGATSSGAAAPGAAAARCASAAPTPLAAPLRRLTRREYNNTVRDLLGDMTAPAAALTVDARPGLFDNNAAAPVTALLASQYADLADTLARAAVPSRLNALVPCVSQDDACARELVRTVGKRAFRRPLTDAEQARMLGVYNAARAAGGDFSTGARLVVATLLQSPHVINHVERGVPAAANKDGAVPLTAYERASRLSYFLWNTMPDAALFAAADANKLATPADIEAQTLRMLADPKARAGILDFFQQWLSLAKVDGLDRSTKAFPLWAPSLRAAMRRETEAFVEHVMWQSDAKLTTLLEARFSFINSPLSKLYDAAPVSGDSLVRSELDPSRRAGLLTQASLLALSAHYDQTSPVHRGLQVRERFLCQETPSPPPNVDVSLPKPDPKLTTRQRFEQHRTDPYCAGCHRLIDPIGIGFESYDAIGRYRATENDLPIDARGEVIATRDLDGTFNGAVELAGRLSRSAEARDCMATLWMSYGTGAGPDEVACAAGRLGPDFAAAGTDLKKLIVAITKSEAFLNRKAIATIATEICK